MVSRILNHVLVSFLKIAATLIFRTNNHKIIQSVQPYWSVSCHFFLLPLKYCEIYIYRKKSPFTERDFTFLNHRWCKFTEAIDRTFNRVTGINKSRRMSEEHEKVCHSLAFGSWLTAFSHVLPTSQMGYYAGKPIERAVPCFHKVKLKCFNFLWVTQCNKR